MKCPNPGCGGTLTLVEGISEPDFYGCSEEGETWLIDDPALTRPAEDCENCGGWDPDDCMVCKNTQMFNVIHEARNAIHDGAPTHQIDEILQRAGVAL